MIVATVGDAIRSISARPTSRKGSVSRFAPGAHRDRVSAFTEIAPGDRDGRLNDWLRSLYSQVSTARFSTSEELVALLEARLREMAAAQETPWIKLGNLVFPGTVSRRRRTGQAEFVVRARVREGSVRRAIGQLGGWSSQVYADRLTWGVETEVVEDVELHVETSSTSEDVVEIRCSTPQHGGRGHHRMAMTIQGLGPSEQAELWVRQAVLGDHVHPARDRAVAVMLEPERPLLGDVLTAVRAEGWIAEGLTRLYIVEGLLTRFGGHFDRLEVGPATSAAVRVSIRFMADAHNARAVGMDGLVRLR